MARFVDFARARILFEELWRDVVGVARVGKGEQRREPGTMRWR